MLAPVCPVLHVYVLAPTAISVADSPWQITEGDAEALTETEPLTTTVTEAVAEHPFLVPVTVYVVVTVGLTVMLLPDSPVLHVYCVAPLAESVDDAPTHIEEGDAVTVTVGGFFTVTVTVLTAAQPLAPVPVTEYVVVTEGLTVMEAVA
jgi:hypothetical protein